MKISHITVDESTHPVNSSHIMPLLLNQNELETLRILWEMGEAKPAEIEAAFSWPIENATLRSVLLNLVTKGHVVREPRGKAYFYTASMPKRTLLQDLLRSLAQIFAGGSSRELVAQLVETGDIQAADLRAIRAVAGKHPPRVKPPLRGRKAGRNAAKVGKNL